MSNYQEQAQAVNEIIETIGEFMQFNDHAALRRLDKSKSKVGRRYIAIPLVKEVLSSHFGRCEQFSIVHIENNVIIDMKLYTPPEHGPGAYPQWLAELNVTDVIAGGVGYKAIDLFNKNRINVFSGAPIKSSKKLVEDFIEGRLQLKANYCDHIGRQGDSQEKCKSH